MTRRARRAIPLVAACCALASVAQAVAAPTPEFEPNNVVGTATTLDPTGRCYAQGAAGIAPIGDIDLWKLPLSANAKLWALVDTGLAPGDGDSGLVLLAPDGTTPIEANNDGAASTGGSTVVDNFLGSILGGATAPSAGTHFLRLNEIGEDAAIDPYRLFVAATTRTTQEAEPNNDVASAQPIPDCVTTVDGTLAAATGPDFYRFAARAGDTVFIDVDGDPERNGPTDVDVRLRSPAGTPLLTLQQLPDKSSAEGFDFTATETGVYSVEVFGGTGTYRVLVATPDVIAPETTITSGPSGLFSDRQPSWLFSGSDDVAAAGNIGFQCATTPAGQPATFSSCGPPAISAPPAPLADGDYTFAVRALDPTGNVDGSPAERSFSIDGTGPAISALSIAFGKPAKRTRTRNATVRFKATDAHGVTLACRIDRKLLAPCTTKRTYKSLKRGRHTVVVQATDSLGNATTRRKTFTVKVPKPKRKPAKHRRRR